VSTRRLRLTPYLLVALPIAVVPATAWQGPLASDSPGFTEAQASAGQVEFARKCAPCHAPDDGGERRAPALSGPSFRDKWGDRRVRQLFVRMRDGMPPVGVRPRGDGYTNILAFLLHRGGGATRPAQLRPAGAGRFRPGAV